jgi:two-component system, OmpR family, KDP operon response regulator KdpE
MHRKRILVVDDELAIIKLLRANLNAEGFEVLTAMDGAQAIQTIEKEAPDLVILDIMMPEMNGFEVCRHVREWSQVPIIMLSAKGSEDDKVKCLDIGADDYITKPFGINELVARVRAVFRRVDSIFTQPAQPAFRADGLEINFAERKVTVAGREKKLTPTEYRLLQELVLNVDKVLTHSMLLGKVWGPEYAEEKEYLHVFIGRLRKELEPHPESPKYIVTVPGVGYRFTTAR